MVGLSAYRAFEGNAYLGVRPPHIPQGVVPMRALTIVAVLLASGARSLCAQHGGQIEIGGFGTFRRYASRSGKGMQVGVGGWLGYFIGDHFSFEVDCNRAQTRSTFLRLG